MATTITEGLWRDFLATLREPRFDPHELRLSESGACPRKRVLAALGAPETHPAPEEDLGVLMAGHLLEEQVAARYREKYGARRVIVQREIRLPKLGASGHIDIWIPAIPLIVECKSTSIKHRDRLPFESHITQTQAYLHFWGRKHGCRRAEIAYIFRETLEMAAFPVVYDPWIGQRIEVETLSLRLAINTLRGMPIEQALAHEDMPPAQEYTGAFPCRWGSNGDERFCPFYGYCAARAEEEKAPVEEPDLADLLRRLRAARDGAAEAKSAAKTHEEIAKALEAQVHAALDAKGYKSCEIEAGGVRFSRKWVEGKTSYDVAKAVEAGVLSSEVLSLLEPYKKQSRGYWSVSVK